MDSFAACRPDTTATTRRGFCTAKTFRAESSTKLAVSLNTSGERRITRALTSRATMLMKGGEPRYAVISDRRSSAVIASGWARATMFLSSLQCWPGPNACSQAIRITGAGGRWG